MIMPVMTVTATPANRGSPTTPKSLPGFIAPPRLVPGFSLA
jgi:hypothetical protein